MTSKTNVVMGEAPESDSEDELNVSDGVAIPPVPDSKTVKGRVIDGEAPESDDETVGKCLTIGAKHIYDIGASINNTIMPILGLE